MSNIKNASLLLNTGDLPYNSLNAFGSTNDSRNIVTWTNINLRTILGDMYDTCDTFNLDLVQIFLQQSLFPLGQNAQDRAFIIQISGLPFINQTYSVRNSCNTNTANLCFYSSIGVNANPLINLYNGSNTLTFGKNQDICDITMSFVRFNGTPINTGTTTISGFQLVVPIPSMSFLFNITGVLKEPVYNNDKRIF